MIPVNGILNSDYECCCGIYDLFNILLCQTHKQLFLARIILRMIERRGSMNYGVSEVLGCGDEIGKLRAVVLVHRRKMRASDNTRILNELVARGDEAIASLNGVPFGQEDCVFVAKRIALPLHKISRHAVDVAFDKIESG